MMLYATSSFCQDIQSDETERIRTLFPQEIQQICSTHIPLNEVFIQGDCGKLIAVFYAAKETNPSHEDIYKDFKDSYILKAYHNNGSFAVYDIIRKQWNNIITQCVYDILYKEPQSWEHRDRIIRATLHAFKAYKDNL